MHFQQMWVGRATGWVFAAEQRQTAGHRLPLLLPAYAAHSHPTTPAPTHHVQVDDGARAARHVRLGAGALAARAGRHERLDARPPRACGPREEQNWQCVKGRPNKHRSSASSLPLACLFWCWLRSAPAASCHRRTNEVQARRLPKVDREVRVVFGGLGRPPAAWRLREGLAFSLVTPGACTKGRRAGGEAQAVGHTLT